MLCLRRKKTQLTHNVNKSCKNIHKNIPPCSLSMSKPGVINNNNMI